MRVLASEQVQEWLKGLPPDTKHKVRLALRKLGTGKGDIKALSNPLGGFNRLRVGSLRIIYRQTGRMEFFLEYANSRDRVYEIFQEVTRAIAEKPKK